MTSPCMDGEYDRDTKKRHKTEDQKSKIKHKEKREKKMYKKDSGSRRGQVHEREREREREREDLHLEQKRSSPRTYSQRIHTPLPPPYATDRPDPGHDVSRN